MLIRRPPDIPERDITDEALYLNRRAWLAAAGVAMSAFLPAPLLVCTSGPPPADDLVTPFDKAIKHIGDINDNLLRIVDILSL